MIGAVGRGTAVAVALAFAGCCLALLFGQAHPFSVAGRGGVAGLVAITGAVALLGSGCLITVLRPRWRSGIVLLLGGCAFLFGAVTGWEGAWPVLRTMAAALSCFALPLLAHAVVRFPGDRHADRAGTILLAIGYGAAAVVATVRLFVADPFLDPDCWSDCGRNPLAVAGSPEVAAVAGVFGSAVGGVALVVGSALAAHGARRAVGARRGAGILVALGGGLTACGAALIAVVLLLGGSDDPGVGGPRVALALVGSGSLAVAAAYTAMLVDGWLRRRRVAMIPATVSAGVRGPGLARALADALGDPELRVAYWLPESGRYVDERGDPVPDPRPVPPMSVTVLTRDGRRVAAITHAIDAVDLDRAIGPALVAALENQLLRVELDAQLTALRESRARIVERADAHRRQLERNLHDGAQQHLIAFAARLRSAAQRARDDDDPARGCLEEAVVQARCAVEDLRGLAQGIYPTVLVNEGLAGGVRALALVAPLPVEIERVADGRFDPLIEASAFDAIVTAADEAARREASHIRVAIVLEDDGRTLIVRLHDDGAGAASVRPLVADRVGALGGIVESLPSGLVVRIPVDRGATRSAPTVDL